MNEVQVATWRARQAENGAVDTQPVPKGCMVMPGPNPTEHSVPLIQHSGHTDHPIVRTGDVIISQPSHTMPDVSPPSYEDGRRWKCTSV